MTTTNALLNSHKTTTAVPVLQFFTIAATLLAFLFLAQTSTAQATGIDVTAPTRKHMTPSKFVVPITASDLTNQGVIAFQFNLLYDPAVITPYGNNFGCSTEGTLAGAVGMVATCNIVPDGTLRVAVYGAYPMSGSGPVVNIRFATARGAMPGSASSLDFNNLYFFNELGYLATTPRNGRITLTLPASTEQPAGIEVFAPETVQRPGSTFVVPITAEIAPESAITAFQFNVAYDPDVINTSGPNFGCSAEGTIGEAVGMFAICNVVQEGMLHVAVFSPYPLNSSGTLLNLTFTAAEHVASDSISSLSFENVSFFGTARGTAVNVHNGQVKVSERTFSKR
jgi:hypothetical protein